MIFRVSTIISVILLSGCSATTEMSEIPREPRPIENKQISEWKPYKVKNSDQMVQTSRADNGWRGNSAWKYPPAAGVSHDGLFIKDAEVERVSIFDTDSSSYANVASDNAPWIDKYVPASVREQFFFAAQDAARNGTSVFIDEETGAHFEMSRVWKAGGCSGLEVTLLSKGGTLPVVSRGTTEVCS